MPEFLLEIVTDPVVISIAVTAAAGALLKIIDHVVKKTKTDIDDKLWFGGIRSIFSRRIGGQK